MTAPDVFPAVTCGICPREAVRVSENHDVAETCQIEMVSKRLKIVSATITRAARDRTRRVSASASVTPEVDMDATIPTPERRVESETIHRSGTVWQAGMFQNSRWVLDMFNVIFQKYPMKSAAFFGLLILRKLSAVYSRALQIPLFPLRCSV